MLTGCATNEDQIAMNKLNALGGFDYSNVTKSKQGENEFIRAIVSGAAPMYYRDWQIRHGEKVVSDTEFNQMLMQQQMQQMQSQLQQIQSNEDAERIKQMYHHR